MGNKLLPRLVVWLCFTLGLLNAAQTFTVYQGNLTSSSPSSTVTIVPDGFTTPVLMRITFTSPKAFALSETEHIFQSASPWQIDVDGTMAAQSVLSFSVNSSDYTAPSSVSIYYTVSVSYTGGSFYPGKTVPGTVTLDASPGNELTVDFVTSSPSLTISPSSFTFKSGQSPYELPYSATSTQPGTYYAYATVRGPDAAFVNLPTPNVTFTVDKRLVQSSPTSQFSTKVGQTTSSITVYLDVAPDVSLNVNIYPSSNNVVANPSVLSFTPLITARTYTLTGNAPDYSVVTYNFTSADADKYVLSSTPTISIDNRTISTSNVPTLLLGVASNPISIFVADAPDPANPLEIRLSSPDSLIFSPPTLSFSTSRAVNTFVVTAQNSSAPSSRRIDYTLVGTLSNWFTVPAPSFVNVDSNKRVVHPDFSFDPSKFPYGSSVAVKLILDRIPPQNFTVKLSAAHATFSPSNITFSNSLGGLEQTFSIRSNTLGADRIEFTIDGPDAALIASISSIPFTVTQYTAPFITVPGVATVGVPLTCTLVVPSPVINDLTITLSSSPSSIPVAIEPSVFQLTSPGLDAGPVTYKFTILASSVGSIVLHPTFTGTDVNLFPAPADVVVSIGSVSFGLGQFVLPSNAVVNVPLTGLRVTLSQPHPTTVTLTPSAASLQFVPASFVFEPAVSEVCVTIIPQVAPLNQETIVFTSSDPTNYVAPSPVTFGPISQKSFDLGQLVNSFELTVGVKSAKFEIRASHPPSTSVTLTPGSTDGLVFEPSVLTFTDTVDVQYLSITANTLNNRNPVVTWSVSGDNGAFATPAVLNQISVLGRSLRVSGDFSDAVVGVASLPVVVSSEYAVPSGLTITPSAPDVVFSPASITLSGATTFAAFTATYPAWVAVGDSASTSVQFTLSGPNAAWYSPLSNNFVVNKRWINLDVNSFTIATGRSGRVVEFTLQAAPETDVSINFCAPGWLVFTPSVLTFNAGQTAASVVVTAKEFFSDAPPSNIVVGLDIVGTDALNYAEPGDLNVNVYTDAGLGLDNFPSSLTLGDAPTVFEIYSSFVEFEPFTVTFTSQGNSVSFTPASVTLSPSALHFFVAVEATGLLSTSGSSSDDVVAFEITGSSGVLGSISPRAITVNKRGISADILTSATVGEFITGSISLEQPPASGTITITALAPTGVTVSPPFLTFDGNSTKAFFVVTSSIVGSQSIGWSVAGNEAAFYQAAPTFTISFSHRMITFNTDTLVLQPGRQNVISFSLSYPVSNGLTVVPVLPSPLVASPATVVLTPGAAVGWFSVATNGGLFTGEYSTILFTLSGADAGLYTANGATVNVEIARGSIGATGFPEQEVGTPQTLFVGLSIATINGLTLTPTASGGVLFEPAVLVFPPGSSTARFVATPLKIGDINIAFTSSGADAWLYSLSATTITSTPRSVNFNWESPSQGDLNTVQFYLNSPPPNGFTIIPRSPALSFSPAQLQFSPTLSSVQLSYEPKSCGPVRVEWELSGIDADWYDASDLGDYAVEIPCIEISIDAALNVVPGIPSSGRAYMEAPADVSVTPSAPGCTFSPPQWTFGANTLSNAFTFVCNVPAPESSVAIPISYAVSGTDANLIQQPVVSDDIAIAPNMLSVPNSLPAVYSGQSFSLQVSLALPPSGEVTVTPQASNLAFDPPFITFNTGRSTTGVFSVTALSPQIISITYALSGPGSSSVGLEYFVTPLVVNYGTLALDLTASEVGVMTGPFTAVLTPPAPSDVAFTPSAPGCQFFPPTISFVKYSNTALVSLRCDSAGEPVIRFAVSGTDQHHYAVHATSSPFVKARTVEVTFNLDLPYAPKIFDESYGFVRLPTATERGLSLTPSSTLLIFDPSTITIPVGGSYAPFKVTGNLLGNDVVSWSLSGDDAALYDVPDNSKFTVAKRTITPKVPTIDTVYAGSISNTFSVVLDRAPTTGLVVRPYGAGLTYTPQQLTFQPGQTGASFQVKVTAPGYLNIYYEVSGADAEYYEEPAESQIQTSLLTLDFEIGNYENPVVGVESPPVLFYSNRPPSDTVTVTFVGAGTFSPSSLTFGPTRSAGTFTYTPSLVGQVAITAVITGPGVVDYSDTLFKSYEFYVAQRLIRLPSKLPDLFANVPSPLLSVAVDDLPPNGLTITPTAANTVFTPSSLQLSSTTAHAEFSLLTSLATEFNNFPGQDSDLAPTTVSWTLSGPDAAWYLPIADQSINVMRRDIAVYYGTSTYQEVPVEITVVTTYPPNGTLTLTPVGNFEFEPSSVTLSPTQNSASFSATPHAAGDAYFNIMYSGSDVLLYQPTEWQGVSVSKWYFDIPSVNAFQYGEWSAPQLIRVSQAPPAEVSITISSDYLDFSPNVLTFGPNTLVAQFQIFLRPGLDYLRQSTHTVHFWHSGPAAYLFSPPGFASFTFDSDYPARTMSLFNAPDELVVGVPSSLFTIRIPNSPVADLTITPIPYSPHVSFTPASVHLSRTSTALTASFTVVVNHPDVTGVVEFSLTGADAAFFAPPSFEIGAVNTRQVSFAQPNLPLTVGTPSAPFVATLEYPTPNGFTVELSSQSIAFTPSVLNFLPGTSTVAFSATPGTAGPSIPVRVSSYGPDANWHDPAAWNFPATLPVNARTWKSTPSSVSTNAGTPFTVEYAVLDAPVANITITPWAPAVVFTPASATLTPATSSCTFTAVGTVGGTSVTVNTMLGGDDASLYNPVSPFSVYVNQLSVRAPSLENEGETSVDLGDNGEILIYVDAPVTGVSVTPSANGLVFAPETFFIPAGHSYAHATYTAVEPGLSQVRFTVSGPDAAMYTVNQPDAAIRVQPLYLASDSPDPITVGSTSATVAIYSRGGASGGQRPPLAPVNVSFLVSPAGAATVTPNEFTLTAPLSSFSVQITPTIASEELLITPVLSGPGAAHYKNVPGSSPNLISFESIRRSFVLTDLYNYFANPAQQQLVVGVETGPFGITALSVPSDVVLHLRAPGLKFIPSALLFTGSFETLYFRILPERPVLTKITFSVGGTSANWFDVPLPTSRIRVTHNFIVPSLPTITIGQIAPEQTIEVVSPLTSTVVLAPTVPNCPGSNARYVNFLPPFLIFTPNTTKQVFTYIGNCATNNLAQNFNPVITDASPRRYTATPAVINVSWNVREAGETSPYILSFPTPNSVLGVNVVQATFEVIYTALEIGKASTVNISVTQAPRSDVVLTLIGNNLNFNPPHVTFFPDTTLQTIQVTIVHADYKDSATIPFTVDYVISGSNWADYVPPAQSFVGVARGEGAVVGGIQGSDASATRVAAWAVIAFVCGVLLFQ